MSYETYKRKIKEDLTKINEGYKAGVIPIDQYMAAVDLITEKLSIMNDPNMNKTFDLFDINKDSIAQELIEVQQRLIQEYEEIIIIILKKL